MARLLTNTYRRIREGYLTLQYARQARRVHRQEPILIFQMGKVGSSTVYETLKHLALRQPIFHFHLLSARRVQHAIDRMRQSAHPFLEEHIIVSKALRKQLDRQPFPCKIITLTREPVGRAVSMIFETLRVWSPEAIVGSSHVDAGRVEQLIRKNLDRDHGAADPGRWFETELKGCFGINVFEHPFDRERGYQILQGEGVSALVLRMEDLNTRLPAALATFLELPAEVPLKRANIGAQKWYSDAYDTFKKDFRVPRDLCEQVYQTTYARHFYAEEIPHLIERWADTQKAVSTNG